MKIVVGSDMKNYVMDVVVVDFCQCGYQVEVFGVLIEMFVMWLKVVLEVVEQVVDGIFEQVVFFCWMGIGISLVVNKVKGICVVFC